VAALGHLRLAIDNAKLRGELDAARGITRLDPAAKHPNRRDDMVICGSPPTQSSLKTQSRFVAAIRVRAHAYPPICVAVAIFALICRGTHIRLFCDVGETFVYEDNPPCGWSAAAALSAHLWRNVHERERASPV
jgi:hypothetical protein